MLENRFFRTPTPQWTPMTAALNLSPLSSEAVEMTLKAHLRALRALSQVLCPSWRPLQQWQDAEQQEQQLGQAPPPRRPTRTTRGTQPTRSTALGSSVAEVSPPAVSPVWFVSRFPLISQEVSSTRSLFGFLLFNPPCSCDISVFHKHIITVFLGAVISQPEPWSK